MPKSKITLDLTNIMNNCKPNDSNNPYALSCNVNDTSGVSGVSGELNGVSKKSYDELGDQSKSDIYTIMSANNNIYSYQQSNDVTCINNYSGFIKMKDNMQTNICLQNCKDGSPFFEKDMNYPICKYRPTITYKSGSNTPDNIICSDGFLLSMDDTTSGVASDFSDSVGMCINLPLSCDLDNIYSIRSEG